MSVVKIPSPITDITSMAQSFVMSVECDSAQEALNGVKSSLFSRHRREARDIYEKYHAHYEGKMTKSIFLAMAAEFKKSLTAGEEAYKGEVPEEKKRTWKQNKSDIGKALSLGFDFLGDPEVSQGKMRKWCKSEELRIQAEAESAALKEQAATGKGPVSPVGGKDKDNQQKTEQKTEQPAHAEGGTTGVTLEAGDDVRQEKVDRFLKLMAGILESNPAKLDKFLDGNLKTLETMNSSLAQLAKAG